MIEVLPAILPQTFNDITERAARVAGIVRRVQIDIVDGSLVPSTTWPYVNDDRTQDFPKLIAQDRALPEWERLEYELDMMVEAPHTVYEQWIDAGMACLIPHREAASDEELRIIMRGCRARGLGFGIALLPSTSTHTIDAWHKDVDFIQVMGSNVIGRQGTPLDDAAVARVSDIHRAYPACTISVDIGVTLETAPRLVAAGARKLISGSTIWNSTDLAATIHALEALG